MSRRRADVAWFDLPLQRLRGFVGDLPEPSDLEEFWRETLTEAEAYPLTTRLDLLPTRWRLVDAYDLTFTGYAGAPVRAWLITPAGASGALPTIVQFRGYGVGRSFPHQFLHWALAGYATVVMDNRGQGHGHGGAGASTADAVPAAGAPHVPGCLTLGITDPHDYYYRRLFIDAVRLLQTLAGLELIDADRVIVTGNSQGGGVCLATAGLASLAGVRLLGAAPEVPFLCAIPRAVQLVDTEPYAEISRYLAGWRDRVDTVYRTLSYFDAAVLGQYAAVPALFSVGLMDTTCPPSTVFAAFNRYGRDAAPAVHKRIEVYPHNGHDGGGGHQVLAQAGFFADLLEDRFP